MKLARMVPVILGPAELSSKKRNRNESSQHRFITGYRSRVDGGDQSPSPCDGTPPIDFLIAGFPFRHYPRLLWLSNEPDVANTLTIGVAFFTIANPGVQRATLVGPLDAAIVTFDDVEIAFRSASSKSSRFQCYILNGLIIERWASF